MKRVCSWCQREMGTVPSGNFPENTITHGICDACLHVHFADLGVNLVALLDNLTAPVLVIDGDGIVRTANRQAQELLQKDLEQISGSKGGVVFECPYAKLEEGCGNTTHCSGCTIRRTVMDTFRSGKSNLERPAVLNRGMPDEVQKIDFLISTEKVEGVVLLRIDKVGDNMADRPANP